MTILSIRRVATVTATAAVAVGLLDDAFPAATAACA